MTIRAAALAFALAFLLPPDLPAAAPALADDTTGAPAKGEKDWKDHTGNIPFIVGSEKGMKEAEFTGKPILYFFTATW